MGATMGTRFGSGKFGLGTGAKNEFHKNGMLFLMILPGVLVLTLNNYLPMFGVVIAFKNFKFFSANFVASLLKSSWVGLRNFEFLFKTSDAWVISRNTLLYNAAFILAGLVISVATAIILNEIRGRKLVKIYQTALFMPYFLSWVVVSYIAFAFLSMDNGFVNRVILPAIGLDPIPWYQEPGYWPAILIFLNAWKWSGYNCIIYLASIIGIDQEYYEAAMIDGANRWQRIIRITLPLIRPVIMMMTLLNIGRIFNADFGLFFQVPRNTGLLYPTTNVIDTYVYNSLMSLGNIGMSSAAALYQSVVGFLLVMVTNRMVKRMNPDYALF
jgi:putative aldouronate transport system permease protein